MTKSAKPVTSDMQINVAYVIKAAMIQSILESCLDDVAIEYWANPDQDKSGNYTEEDVEGKIASIRISLIEPLADHASKHTIDAQVIALGIQRIMKGETPVNCGTVGNVAQTMITGEDVLDADDIDCIVQAGLFNNLVFG